MINPAAINDQSSRAATTRFPMADSKVFCLGDTLQVAHNLTNVYVRSNNGTATNVAYDGVCITGGTHRGGANGIRSVGKNNVKLDGVKGVADTFGAGILIDGGSKVTLLHTNASSTNNTGNSLKVTAATTKLTMLGNSYGTGTADISASATYTLKDF